MVPTFNVGINKRQRDDVSKNGQRLLLVDCEKVPIVLWDNVFKWCVDFIGRHACQANHN